MNLEEERKQREKLMRRGMPIRPLEALSALLTFAFIVAACAALWWIAFKLETVFGPEQSGLFPKRGQ